MNILIVDDSPQRLQPLIARLESLGVPRDEIVITQSAMDARAHLEDRQFDLLILDICLPRRAEDTPADASSLELLEDVVEGDELMPPRHILCLTAHDSSAASVSEKFRQHTWAIVRYASDNDEWIGQIANAVSWLIKTSNASEPRRYGVDLAIVTALRDPELEAVLKNGWAWSPAEPLDESTFIQRTTFESKGRTLTACAASAPRMGMVSTALLASKIIAELRPRFIVMTGICAGVPLKVELGDVILADPSWDYQSGKRVKDKEVTQFSISPHQLDVAEDIRSRVDQISTDKTFLRKVRDDWRADGSREFHVKIGPVASGSAVLADGDALEDIKRQKRELIGIEMEVYGLYAAARAAGSPKPSALALKAVCDFADPDKKDEMQKYAAYTSASVMTELFERYGHDLVRS